MAYDEYDVDSFTEDTEFNQIINQIVDKEVSLRMQDKIDEIERLKEFKDKYQKAQHQLYQIDDLHKKELQMAIKEAKDEVKRSIFGGFKFGDTVYHYKDCGETVICSTCNGSGKVSVSFGNRVIETRCPDCDYGKIHIKNYKPIKASVTEIKFQQWAQERYTKLSFWIQPVRGEDIKRDGETLFKTEEECQKKCDELNAK